LQVGGTELDDPPPAPVEAGTPLVLLSPHLELTAGKAMAQGAHAAQLGWRASAPADRDVWAAGDFRLAVRTATPAAWRRALEAGAPVVQDGGFTEVEPGTRTAVAMLPWLPSAAGQSSEV
jgi:peptidyl-tRNA hydrolase